VNQTKKIKQDTEKSQTTCLTDVDESTTCIADDSFIMELPNIRWAFKHDGTKVLQCVCKVFSGCNMGLEWVDIPIVTLDKNNSVVGKFVPSTCKNHPMTLEKNNEL